MLYIDLAQRNRERDKRQNNVEKKVMVEWDVMLFTIFDS